MKINWSEASTKRGLIWLITPVTSGVQVGSNAVNTPTPDTIYGTVVFTNISGNNWIISGTSFRASTGANVVFFISGSGSATATLDRVILTTVAGATLTAGTANIMYE